MNELLSSVVQWNTIATILLCIYFCTMSQIEGTCHEDHSPVDDSD